MTGLGLGASATADIVRLQDGRQLDNVIVLRETATELFVSRGGIELSIPRDQVARVETQPTVEETLAKLLREAGDDPAALQAAAHFAGTQGLARRAAELRAEAEQAYVARLIAAAPAGDADALFSVAARIEREQLSRASLERVLDLAVLADPDHAEARAARGEVSFEGAWVAPSEQARILAERFAQEMREKGMVHYEGEWVRPEVKLFEETRRQLAAELDEVRRLRVTLERELAAVRAEADRLVRDRDALAARERALADRERIVDRRERDLRDAQLYGNPYGAGVTVYPGHMASACRWGCAAGRCRSTCFNAGVRPQPPTMVAPRPAPTPAPTPVAPPRVIPAAPRPSFVVAPRRNAPIGVTPPAPSSGQPGFVVRPRR